ncbi:hypothetical protein PR048_025713 [Dryococelus australis]|uniref:HTH psq-type domain-containing protein n=1 Tax=Dryococelus australis TaxID=614101 RepID=A0ABQ9GJA9_9NEOP|nr:hypothetical protein PR048_025713 [Dryococelus australis]
MKADDSPLYPSDVRGRGRQSGAGEGERLKEPRYQGECSRGATVVTWVEMEQLLKYMALKRVWPEIKTRWLMGAVMTKRGRCCNSMEIELQLAIDAFKNGDCGLNECARVYGIPRGIIKRSSYSKNI